MAWSMSLAIALPCRREVAVTITKKSTIGVVFLQVEQEDVFSSIVLGDPGTDPGVLEGQARPPRLAPGGRVMRDIILDRVDRTGAKGPLTAVSGRVRGRASYR